ncbi:MAG: 4'-phosphopantetheinyl transferase superfamily protein [Deltaproteobacteria bacterium]|jgi:4'-phosphopantetheinyl transferase|nr:4'-phosphopantetheinyl transferase superfamily protein [Deltaproteobacteria bacterium]
MDLYFTNFTTTQRSKQTVESQEFIKKTLAKYYHCQPQDLILNKTPNGKPFVLEPNPQPCPCYFNLSHSGDYLALAVNQQPIGIDLEYMKDRNFLALAKNYFHLSEIESLQQVSLLKRTNQNNQELKKLFYTYWTLKEAFIKCQGSTLAALLRELEFSVTNGNFALLSPKNKQNYIFTSETVFENYICSTCSPL